MTTLKFMAVVFGAVLVLLSMDHAFAKSDKQRAEPENKAIGSEKKTIMVGPPASGRSKDKAGKSDPLIKRVDALFKRVDANKDDKVSYDEYMAPDALFFKESDRNNDGFLTKEELEKAWIKKMKDKKYRMMQDQLKQKQQSK